jgi:hypothetical protein
MLGIAARLVSFGTLHLAGLPLSFAALAWLDPRLTMLVVASALVGVIPYYLLSMRGARYRNRLERFGAPAMDERRQIARRVMGAPGRIESDDTDLTGAFDRGASYRHGEAFAEQRNVMEASTFASQVVIALALGLVITVGGAQVLAGAGTWSGLLAFLVVLRFAGMKLIGTARVLVSINRFYPAVRRYSDLMRGFDEGVGAGSDGVVGPSGHPSDTDDQAEDTGPRPTPAAELRCRDAAGTLVQLDRGAPIGLLLPEGLQRPHLAVLYRHLRLTTAAPTGGLAAAAGRPLQRFWLALAYAGQSAESLRRVYGLPAEVPDSDVQARLRAYGCDKNVAARIASRLDKPVDAAAQRQLGGGGAALLTLVAGEIARPDALVTDAGVLAQLPDAAAALAERLPVGTALIAAASELDALEAAGVRQALVCDGTYLLDIRTLAEIQDNADLARLMAEARKASQQRADTFDDVEDDELTI